MSSNEDYHIFTPYPNPWRSSAITPERGRLGLDANPHRYMPNTGSGGASTAQGGTGQGAAQGLTASGGAAHAGAAQAGTSAGNPSQRNGSGDSSASSSGVSSSYHEPGITGTSGGFTREFDPYDVWTGVRRSDVAPPRFPHQRELQEPRLTREASLRESLARRNMGDRSRLDDSPGGGGGHGGRR